MLNAECFSFFFFIRSCINKFPCTACEGKLRKRHAVCLANTTVGEQKSSESLQTQDASGLMHNYTFVPPRIGVNVSRVTRLSTGNSLR